MPSRDTDADVPLPISLLLEQETDEECVVYLDFDTFTQSDNYTRGRLVAVSDITSAEYTITNSFQVPCKNISNIRSEDDAERIVLNECSTDDLETLFDMVSINYTIGNDTAEIDTEK